jgi:hypothetical protein
MVIGTRVVLRLKKSGRKMGSDLYSGNLANGTVRYIGIVKEGVTADTASDRAQYGIELDEVRGLVAVDADV